MEIVSKLMDYCSFPNEKPKHLDLKKYQIARHTLYDGNFFIFLAN
jgi:hypothetical protein